MARKTIITVVVLLALLGLLYWYQASREDDNTAEQTELSTSVFNKTKNVDAETVTATPKDELVYTLTVRNTSDETVSGYVVETSIDDISQLATLIDAQGANYNASTNSLMWTPLDIPSNGSIEKQFTVRVKDSLPADSDLIMTVTYGDEAIVAVAREAAVAPTPAPVPSGTPAPNPPYKAPTTGPSAWFAFLLAIAFTVGVVLYRTAKSISLE
ncbi:MAG: DUF11 domain-containing protein [Candidatus Doudnabacteria bacterium]|nr:DUF11 domain-containing protein [Candidatus Doudnabacteria bacterium]